MKLLNKFFKKTKIEKKESLRKVKDISRTEKIKDTNKIKDSVYKDFVKFLRKVKTSKQPIKYIYRFNRYKFYKLLSKSYPKSTYFFSKFLEKYPQNIKFFYVPGTGAIYYGPFLIRYRFNLTEKILSKLMEKGIDLKTIVENEKVSMSILSKFSITNTNKLSESEKFKKYINNLEKELKK